MDRCADGQPDQEPHPGFDTQVEHQVGADQSRPNVRFRVGDPESGLDVDVPAEGPSEPGEVWCTGPNAMPGYLGVSEDTDLVLDADGWNRSIGWPPEVASYKRLGGHLR